MQAYLDRYQETLPDARQLQFCGNAAVNAVLSYFAQQAAAQQVDFSVKAQLPEYTGVADPDLAVLFGNLLENALTACMQEASPRIVVRITADAHTLCAAVDNTFTGVVRRTTGGFLSTKHAGLGLGTASVRSIAEKYHGVCRLEPRDGMFCASVLLELPQEAVKKDRRDVSRRHPGGLFVCSLVRPCPLMVKPSGVGCFRSSLAASSSPGKCSVRSNSASCVAPLMYTRLFSSLNQLIRIRTS